jgi:hypothetical protein
MGGFKLPTIAVQAVVPGREVLIDADCCAYYGAAGCDDMTLRSATRRADMRMKQIIDETRAETYTGYLTGKNNFRDIIATLQRYKGNRYDKNGKRITVQPKWLPMVRLHLQNKWACRICEGQEADDALSIHQNQAEHETVISSIDKDLLINSGLHHDMTSGEVFKSEGYGEIWMKGSACKGHGLKFFLAQLLMGDSADWIKGLPKVTPMMKKDYGIARLGGCGAKSAFLVIEPTTTYDMGLARVQDCYEDFWKDNEYSHWLTGKKYEAGRATAHAQLEEQGQLLWMRRRENEIWTLNMNVQRTEK